MTTPCPEKLTLDPEGQLILDTGRGRLRQSKPLIYQDTAGGRREIAVDATGHAYITGYTQSLNFPTQDPLQPVIAASAAKDVFVIKLTPDGAGLVYSTYLGGKGHDEGRGIAVDGTGQAHVTGVTRSTDFPVVNPVQGGLGGGSDAFVAALTADGAGLVYATWFNPRKAEPGMGSAG